jgi:hypothetical protein
VSPLWWVWSVLGLLLTVAAFGIGGRGAWRCWRASRGPLEGRSPGLVDGGRMLMLAGLTAGTGWLCLVAAVATR